MPDKKPDPTVGERLKAGTKAFLDPFLNMSLAAKTPPPSEKFRETPPVARPAANPFALPKFGVSSDDEEEYKSKMDRAMDYGYTALDKQNADADALRTELEKYNSIPQQLDLTPLMAYGDRISGANTAKTYKAPETPQEKVAVRTALLQGIYKAQTGINEKEAELLKNNVNDMGELIKVKQYGSHSGDKADSVKDFRQKQLDRQLGNDAQDRRTKFRQGYGEAFDQSAAFAGSSSQVLDILDETGGALPGPTSPKYADLKAAHARMIAAYNRGVAKLGALSGGDENILNAAIGPIKDFRDFVTLATRGGGSTLKKVVEDARGVALQAHNDAIGLADSEFGDSIGEMRNKYDKNFMSKYQRGGRQPAPVSQPEGSIDPQKKKPAMSPEERARKLKFLKDAGKI